MMGGWPKRWSSVKLRILCCCIRFLSQCCEVAAQALFCHLKNTRAAAYEHRRGERSSASSIVAGLLQLGSIMIKLQPYQCALFLLLFTFFVPLQGSATDEESPLLNTFKQRYDQVLQRVKQGKLSDSTGNQARDLWLSLRQDLIYLDARLDAYKLATQETTGARQQEAMQNLVELSAERERLLVNAIQTLDRLAQDEKTEIPVSTARPQKTPSSEGGANNQGKGSVTISIEPEDLTDPKWGD